MKKDTGNNEVKKGVKKSVKSTEKETKNKVKNKKNITKKRITTDVDNCNDSKKIDLKKFLTKVNITYFILLFLDISLVIYMARQNVVNYVVVLDEEIFVGKTRYLLLGRNYVNIIIIAFFYIYTCLVNKFFLKRKNTSKFLLWLFVVLVVLNIFLFFMFTKRIY